MGVSPIKNLKKTGIWSRFEKYFQKNYKNWCSVWQNIYKFVYICIHETIAT